MSLLIKNGRLVTDRENYLADIFCEDERITRIAPDLNVPPGATVIDASGKYVFPGFVDPHAHIWLPLKTMCSKDDYASGSRAALIGGTTCFIDFCSPDRSQLPLDTLARWRAKSENNSACDFSLHMAVTRFDPEVEAQLREVVAAGVRSFKVYLAYKDSVNISDGELEGVMRLAAELGVIVLGHCEDAEEIDRRQKALLAEGKTEPGWHYDSRPPCIEAAGTRHFLELAARAGAEAYVVHLSCAEALDEAIAARAGGAKVWIEVLTSHLLLDRSYAELPDFEGAKYVVSPPLREKANQDVLWRAIREKAVDTIGSDHAPFDFLGQKTVGKGNFTLIPNGMPTLEDRVNLLFTYGVLEGRISLERMVEVASTQPARIFGLYPAKGAIAVGSDADLVVYDPEHRGVVSARTHSMNVDYNPFEGRQIRGRPEVVSVRGEIVVRDGRFIGDGSRGRFIAQRQ